MNLKDVDECLDVCSEDLIIELDELNEEIDQMHEELSILKKSRLRLKTRIRHAEKKEAF